MPIYISVLLCALGTNQCHVWLPREAPVIGLAACQIEGEESAATFISEHPQWYVKAIRCSLGNRPRAEDQA